MLHLLNFQFQGIQGAEDLLHAVGIVHVVVGVPVVQQLAGIDVPPGPLGSLDGQGLDDFSRRTLMSGGKTRNNFSFHWEKDKEMDKAATSQNTHWPWKTPVDGADKTSGFNIFHLPLSSSH